METIVECEIAAPSFDFQSFVSNNRLMSKAAPISTAAATDSTRDRLLAAAKAQFAERGYEAASVRELTQAAETNIASVNYHFGDKLGLYVEVFQEIFTDLRELRIRRIDEVMRKPDVTLRDLVAAFAWAFFEPLLKRDDGGFMMHLFMREMTDRRLPEGMVEEQLISPITLRLLDALRNLLPTLEQRDARMCIMSLVGQLIQVSMVMPIRNTASIYPQRVVEGIELQQALEHVVRFSTAGIEAVAAHSEAQP